MMRSRWAVSVAVLLWHLPFGFCDEPDSWTRTADVIYGRKHGLAMTLDVFTPGPGGTGSSHRNPAVIYVVSGGWLSSTNMINVDVLRHFLHRGYTVFAVVHGSQPKFTIPEIMEDMHRSVRFIRHHAGKYRIDAERIGIVGCSAGGHLSLMIGMAGQKGNEDASDPIDRESSRVQAVGCYFPPTDFMNYGRPGRVVFEALENELAVFKAPFDFQTMDNEKRRYLPVTDTSDRLRIVRAISPISHVTPDDPPTLIIHGDADTLVPIQQAELMTQALEKAGVPVKLVVKPGQGHGWQGWIGDMATVADWLDEHLNLKRAEPNAR